MMSTYRGAHLKNYFKKMSSINVSPEDTAIVSQKMRTHRDGFCISPGECLLTAREDSGQALEHPEKLILQKAGDGDAAALVPIPSF